MPNLGEAFLRPYADAERIAADPDYGQVVCFCERVTAGEIRDAFASPIPPADLSGLRRRTRAMNGRCQGFYCGAEINAVLEQQPVSAAGRHRRRRPGRPHRRGRTRARMRACSCSNASRRPAASRGTAPIPATACATCTGSSAARTTRGAS